MWKMFSSIESKLSARRKPTYNVVGQLRDDCRVGFKFLNCPAGRNQSFGDGFGHHSSMQNLSDNGGSDVRFHFTARHAAEKIRTISRLVG